MVVEIYQDWFLISALGFLFAYLFVWEPYGRIIEMFPYKPINCVLCLSFWSSLIILTLLKENPLGAIYVAFIAELSYRKLVNE